MEREIGLEVWCGSRLCDVSVLYFKFRLVIPRFDALGLRDFSSFRANRGCMVW